MATLPQIAILPTMTKTSYDAVKDFSPISIVGTNPYVLVVHPGLPVKTVAEFIGYARSHPNSLNYAAAGVGSLTHLAAVLFLERAGLDMIPVMYKGGGAAAVLISLPAMSKCISRTCRTSCNMRRVVRSGRLRYRARREPRKFPMSRRSSSPDFRDSGSLAGSA